MNSENLWVAKNRTNPGHSASFMARFANLKADGVDVDGEARFADSLVAPASRILDAGCGMGRIGGELSRRGHTVIGVDLDAELIDAARREHPGASWRLGDLTELNIPGERFDLIVCAGNVMAFLAPGSAPTVLTHYREHLAPQGRAVVGFGAGRGYGFPDFFADVEDAGLIVMGQFATWQLHPFTPESDFLVALVGPEPAAG